MHFSIPDTSQATDEDGRKYWLFNINVNGVFHCSLRYSEMDKLHEQLKKEYPTQIQSKFFPGKKLFALSPDQLEERRAMLEKFIQSLSQDPEILNSYTFVTFFLKAQQKTRQVDVEDVEMNIYLVNGNKVSIELNSLDQADDVLECKAVHDVILLLTSLLATKVLDKRNYKTIALKKIGLPDKFVYYFGLYLVSLDNKNELKLLRRVQDFEAPFLSLKSVKSSHRIVIRKSYWSSKYDNDLLDDRIALNLLYVQALDDIERNWTLTTKADKEKLKLLSSSGSRREFVEYARTLKYYGYIHFDICESDYPEKGSQIAIAAGEREFNVQVHTDSDKIMEGSFKVQRIRSWKLTSSEEEHSSSKSSGQMQFAFEYLFGKGDLRWITIYSSQAILMSMTIQGMINEILREQQGKPWKVPLGKERRSRSLNESSPAKAQLSSEPSSPKRQVSAISSSESERSSVSNGVSSPTSKKIVGKVQGILGKKSEGMNEVFEDIGDEDL